MTDNVHERIRRLAGSNGQSEPGDSQDGKQAPGRLNLSSLAIVQKVYSTSISVPEVKPLGHDRRSRREAHEQQRELSLIALRAAKVGMAMDAERAMGSFAVAAFDRAQEDIMDIYHSKSRYPEIDEMMGQFCAQCLQQTAGGILALNELHIQRQAQEL